MSTTIARRRKPASPTLGESAAKPVHATDTQNLARMPNEVRAEFAAVHLELELVKSLLRLSVAVTESQEHRLRGDPGAHLGSDYWLG